MSLVVAVEPDPEQASKVTAVVGELPDAELILAPSAAAAVTQLAGRIPDLVLTSALISPADDALITAMLRERGIAAAHVQTLTIPLLQGVPQARRTGLLSVFRRRPAPDLAGCAPDAFAEQLREYLELALAERRRLDTVIAAPAHPARAAAEPTPAEEEGEGTDSLITTRR